MKVYFRYGHKCLDEWNTVVEKQVSTWKWNLFFIFETIKDIIRELKLCKKQGYKFFICKGYK